ncbi:ATP-binding cassette domain-containing protein [Acidovorax sp. SRB_24]|uniref:ABC transporter ATP-binding protein n=1 Tax=Acidovorax sp. SRB_24 TaxID=1962700 RepID=UPI00145DBF67|nr:ATP-binding cassette domain-containing protein [Acidovorax sp. SRB_24]NMM76123.1 ABC transporter [Acidovorax sp. SRB_24]
MDKASPVLQVDGLCFGYPQRVLFTDWCLSVRSGATLLQGGDSSGKTTLLRLLAGAVAAQQGHWVLRGVRVAPQAQAYRHQVFWQDPRSDALHALSARAWWAELAAQHAAWDAAALAAHVQGWGLQPHLDKALHQLSAGSQRKVLMAAALASGAALTLIDEPVAGLDQPSVRYLCQALAASAAQPGRAIVVAHYGTLPGVPWTEVVALPEPAE